MKFFKKILCLSLCALFVLPWAAPRASGAKTAKKPASKSSDYTVKSPYEDVIWKGEGAWGEYKGNLHSHTTYSDADDDLPTMVKEYYKQGFDFLANSDHGITGAPWNEEQTRLALYTYQRIIGKSVKPLTQKEFDEITSGSYPLENGKPRGKKMVCVCGANELNNLTLTKCHVNGYFLPRGVGDGFGGFENNYELAIKFVEKNGGLSHINHPGDWLESNANPSAVSDPKNVKFFGDLLLKYPTCLGIEAFNERNSVTGYDRILWDNLLMYVLPYGRTVIGFSNTDAHSTNNVDTSFSVFMMEKNDVENIKKTMQSGSFFAVTRIVRANDVIGNESIDVRNKGLAYPMFTYIDVKGHTITASAREAKSIRWIADGKVVKESAIGPTPVSIDLDEINGAENFKYVRAEIYGEGGICLTQAFVIDDGSEPLVFKEETGPAAALDRFFFAIKSTRLYVIVQELARAIKGKLG